MFLMVYFHYRPVCLEQLLYKYFSTSPGEYTIPSNIEEYLEHDDHHLLKILRNSANPYAQSIIRNEIPKKIFESFNLKQLKKLESIEQYLSSINADFIRCSSSGRLSKYYTEAAPLHRHPIKVFRRTFNSNTNSYLNIDEATDLFDKFSESHAVNRLHCNLEKLTEHERITLMKMISN